MDFSDFEFDGNYVDEMIRRHDQYQKVINDLLLHAKLTFDSGERKEALDTLGQIIQLDLTHLQKGYLAKLAFNLGMICSDENDVSTSIVFFKFSFGFSRELNPGPDTDFLTSQVLMSLVKLYDRDQSFESAEICAALIPDDPDPFQKHLLKTYIFVRNQDRHAKEKFDNFFVRCLEARNFDTLSQAKQLLTVLQGGNLGGSLDESTFVGHLFDESKKKLDLTTAEMDEWLSIQIIYFLDKNRYDQAFLYLSNYIQWQANQTSNEKTDYSHASPHLARILGFCHDVIEIYFADKKFSDVKKWSAALVFLCQETGQSTDKFLYSLIMSTMELDGHAEAQRIMKFHRDRDPENPTIIKLQYELALKHGDGDEQIAVLLSNGRYLNLIEAFPIMKAGIIEFFSQALEQMDLKDIATVLEGTIFKPWQGSGLGLQHLLLKILIRLYLYLWSTEVGSQEETPSKFLPKLIDTTEKVLSDLNTSTSDRSEEKEFRVWISNISWNVALQVTDPGLRFQFFGFAADALPIGDDSRFSCRLVQVGVAIDYIESAKEKDKVLISKINILIAECDRFVSKLNTTSEPEVAMQSKRMLCIYKLKLCLLTYTDVEANLESVISTLEHDADEVGLQLVAALISQSPYKSDRVFRLARVRCLKTVLELVPKGKMTVQVCLELLDELLEAPAKILQTEIGKLVQTLIAICKNDSESQEEQVVIALTKIWNTGIKFGLLRMDEIAVQLSQLALALVEWVPNYKKYFEDKMKVPVSK